MKFAAWDLEIHKELPDDADWKTHSPLGISTMAIMSEGFYLQMDGRSSVDGAITKAGCGIFINCMEQLVQDGHTIVTFNGAGFDFSVLAEECNTLDRIRNLALNHIDLMFLVVAIKGHYLGLDTACRGMNVQGKLQNVHLNNGQRITNMSGKLAPKLWRNKEFNAVNAYLAEDVRSLLDLAKAVYAQQELNWISKSGRFNSIALPELFTVEQAMNLPEPDTSWMTDPPRREDILGWMNLP